ncbi:MAG: tetratricopeptide repeat protein [Gallionella sp.]|nr:MAG: tetratricopeptide repeat protein [Gallionella sp.]
MKKLDKMIAEAALETEARRFSAAEKIYRKIIREDPRHLDGHYLLGSLLAERGELKPAEKHLKIAAELLPSSPYIWNNLGNIRLLAGDDEGALSAWSNALKFKPDLAEAWCNTGLVYMRHENFDEAENCMRKAVASKNLAQAWYALANLAEKRGNTEEAVLICRKVLGFQPGYHSAAFMLSRLEGRPMACPPRQTIKNLFDNHAKRFESHLTGKLAYSIPDSIDEIIRSHAGIQRFDRAVDLGCGTGLMGLRLAERVDELVGVDLSPRMLDEAKEKNIYKRLAESDLTEFLDAEKKPFDLFLAADVMVYMGELENLFAAAFNRASENAIFAFSTEKSDGSGWELRNTGRYAHADAFVRQSAENAGWSVLACENVVVRLESGSPVEGNIFLMARK